MTKDRHFPIPVVPQDDELLSSYLARVAHVHGEKASAFCHAYIRKRQIWNVDLDRTTNPELLESIASLSDLTLERVQMMTLADYEAILSAGPKRKGKGVWILAAGSFHQLRRRHWLQYCPRCLGEDERPYFRREWRLAFVVGCECHGLPLLDSCPSCDRPLAPHRTPPGGMTICPFCRASLIPNKSLGAIPFQVPAHFSATRRSEGGIKPSGVPRDDIPVDANLQGAADPSSGEIRGKGEDASSLPNAIKQAAISALCDGHAVLGNSTVSAEEYFATLRAIASALSSKNQMQRLCDHYSIPTPAIDDEDRHEIELSRRPFRAAILQALGGLIADWPESFEAGAKAAGFTRRSFRKRGDDIPSLSEELDKLPPGIAHSRPSRAEGKGVSRTSDSSGHQLVRRIRGKARSHSNPLKTRLLDDIDRLKGAGSKQYRASRAALLLGFVALSRKEK